MRVVFYLLFIVTLNFLSAQSIESVSYDGQYFKWRNVDSIEIVVIEQAIKKNKWKTIREVQVVDPNYRGENTIYYNTVKLYGRTNYRLSSKGSKEYVEISNTENGCFFFYRDSSVIELIKESIEVEVDSFGKEIRPLLEYQVFNNYGIKIDSGKGTSYILDFDSTGVYYLDYDNRTEKLMYRSMSD